MWRPGPVGYDFRGSWTVPAPPDPVREIVVDLEHYPEWWPQVVAVAKIGPDDARVLCRSTLPYTLDLTLHATSREGRLLEVDVTGDLEGSVRWLLTPVPEGTRMDFEQRVEVRGLLAAASLLGRPMLRWNHERMMRGCISGLVRRLGTDGVRSGRRPDARWRRP